ncbi:epsin-2 isoform X6 [Ursus maritimus]|uniref:Epsin-2 isoform X6 n=1 Tax=Ursus maritimus TaxID=29073 RepID=A0A8M1G119_URSMA|nr:epsin-2 isoform X6 [Ursus maritimus]
MATSSIRRQMKNIVNNYSEAEIKVREATSNDPWGPSSSLMTEIADLTYNVVAFSEIMSMVWKRLNDHGKNWRHVYKALTLLDYLIKTGSERVAQQCRENIFAIQTLKDFQYIDRDGKDQGINVREKSKQLVALLKDEERLKAERAQALKTKERMAQVATGMGSNQITFGRGSSQPNLSTSYSEQEYGKAGGSPASYHGSTSPRVSSELEQARPQTSGEEELQLQLALAMSREVAEQVGARQEERLRRGDDLRLQMALEESRRDTVKVPKKKEHGSHPQQTTLLDLMDALPSSGPASQKAEPWGRSASANQTNPWGGPAAPASTSDPWPPFAQFPGCLSKCTKCQALSCYPGTQTQTEAGLGPQPAECWPDVARIEQVLFSPRHCFYHVVRSGGDAEPRPCEALCWGRARACPHCDSSRDQCHVQQSWAWGEQLPSRGGGSVCDSAKTRWKGQSSFWREGLEHTHSEKLTKLGSHAGHKG